MGSVPKASLLIGVGLYLALLLADPWAALAAGGLIYLGMLPLSLRSYLKLKREAETSHPEAPAPTGT